MFRVFLVEDEVVVREGIKNNMNWEEHGFLFCGEASDGELAYPMIQNLKPDIVITDIRMPFMDGLELSRLIKKELPGTKIIILSGFGEFEYAKEAIHIGITEYLLKPIRGMELMKCLSSVREKMIKELEEKENKETYQREMGEYIENEKRKLFHDLVHGLNSYSDILKRGKEVNLELTALVYNMIVFTLDLPRQRKLEVEELLEINKELDELLDQKDTIIKFDLYMESIAILIKGNSEEEVITTQEYYINKIKDMMRHRDKLSYFGGIGKMVKRLGEIPLSFHEASRAAAYRYIWDRNEILDSGMISKDSIGIDNLSVNTSNTASYDNDVIMRAKQYMMENYQREDLSLQMVSSSVFISPSHFSAIFSQRTGETFIKYLTDLRMNKAKELLKGTDMRTSDIAYLVGYKDPHYFSYLFKKTQTITPKQYRYERVKKGWREC